MFIHRHRSYSSVIVSFLLALTQKILLTTKKISPTMTSFSNQPQCQDQCAKTKTSATASVLCS